LGCKSLPPPFLNTMQAIQLEQNSTTVAPLYAHHFLMNEPKFALRIFDIFKQPELVNRYWVTVSDRSENQIPQSKSLLFQDINDQHYLASIADRFGEANIFIFHYFSLDHVSLFKLLSQKSCTILQLWGGDYSPHYISPINLYLKQTYAECILPQSKLNKTPIPLARLYHHLKWVMNPKSRSYRRVLKSAFHVGFELGGVEQKLFNMRTRTQNSLHIPYSIDLTQYPKELNHQSTRHDILLGNSATATNNHIEVISWVSQHKTNFNVCHIPLSYGDSTIQLSVAKHATKKLPTQAHILRGFMAKKDYFAMLESTEYVIMNHCRQQALGNVLWGLATGRTIYLNHAGPIFKACIYHGLHIKSTASLEHTPPSPITIQEKNQNRLKLDSFYPSNISLRSDLIELIDKWKTRA